MLTEPQGTENTENFEQSLGEQLIASGKCDQSGLERARRLGGESHERIDLVLTKLGIVSEADMAEALSQLLGIPLVRADDYPETRILDSEVSARFLKEARRCVTPKRRARSCPRAVRQPIRKWPRLLRNKYWNDPVQLTLVGNA